MSAAQNPARSYELGDDVGSTIDWSGVELSSEEVRATVSEGDTRTLNGVSDALTAFDDYREDKEDSVLVLGAKESDDVMVVDHEHRWTESYRKKTYAKLKAAEDYIREVWGQECPTTLLTLTAPHKNEIGEYRPPADVLQELSDGWDKARRVLRRETEGTKTEYMAVWEPHASGYPHLHVLVFGVARPSIGSKITDMWANKYVENASEEAQDVEIRRNRSAQVENPAAYVMKYLSKTLARESNDSNKEESADPKVKGFKVFSALLWATGKRHYSMSEGLTAAIKDRAPDNDLKGDDQTWEFLGAAKGIDLGFYEGRYGAKVRKYLKGSKSQTTPPKQQVSIYQQSSLISVNGSHFSKI